MKLIRPLILALAIAGGFFYFTTWRSNSHSTALHPSNWLSQPAKVEITEAAGNESLDDEEQNNISVYRKNIPSVVNVTSRAMTFDFFYGDRKSTRLNSSHANISYAVFCLKK